MKNALQLIELQDDNFDIDQESIGDRFTNTPLYILFNKLYKLDRASYIRQEYRYYSSQFKMIDLFAKSVYEFDNASVLISKYLRPQDIEKELSQYIDMGDEWERGLIEKDLLPIGVSATNQYLLLGIGKENAEKIYYEDRDVPEIVLLANNIFEYFLKIVVVPETSKWLPDLGVLYKNWNEDFWRVREDGDQTEIIEKKQSEIGQLTSEKDRFFYKLKAIAREFKKQGLLLEEISKKTGFTVEEIEKF